MKKIYSILILLLLFLTACSNESTKEFQKPSVVVTTFAIYDIAKHLGGNDIEVSMLIPFGKEVHSFEPTPKQIVNLQRAKLFFYSGAGLEPWAKQFDDGKKGVDLSRFVILKKAKEHHHEKHHHHNGIDPHYWLDFDNMKKIAKIIEEKFIALLPKKEKEFKKRLEKYDAMLVKLDKAYKKALVHNECRKKEIFVNHNAYSYLASRYGFAVDSLVGLSPDAQPSPKTIEKTILQIKKEDIKTIFCESFENNAILQSIAKDTGVDVAVLQPLANITAKDAKADVTYESLMLQNLKKIAHALECNGF